MMSHSIRNTTGRGMRAAASAWLLALALLLCSQGASADPVVAQQVLQLAKSDYQLLKLQYQTGRVFATTGQADPARAQFAAAQLKAQQLTQDLLNLRAQNIDTLQNGLCHDCDAQQEAIDFNDLASLQAQQLQSYLSVLTALPTSLPHIIAADNKIYVLDIDMSQLEQAMVAAQQ